MDKDFFLVWKMKNGDEKSMDVFVRKCYPLILRYCRYHIPNNEDAQDLTQETFKRFFQALAQYQHTGKAMNYLYVIARNLCIDFGKTRKEIIMEEIPEPEENQFNGIVERLDMEQALTCLSNELREVIILHYFQDLSLREVSKVLDIGLPLVKYRIKRAKEQLGKILGKEDSI